MDSESLLLADVYLDQEQGNRDELTGGESRDVEIADFPDIGKRMQFRGGDVEIFDTADAKPFGVKIDT